MWHLYLDESGDLGFDFVNKKPSKFFTVAILAIRTKENNRKLIKATKITLRRKFNIKKVKADELKGSKCPFAIKKYFYRQVMDTKFSIYSITLNKIKLYERLRENKEIVYNYVTRLVLEQIPFNQAELRVNIIIDKSKIKKNIFEFNQYVLRQIESKFDPKVPLDIFHYNSKQNFGLQAVDMFCWGIFRKYEYNDLKWYNVFKEKIVYDKQYL